MNIWLTIDQSNNGQWLIRFPGFSSYFGPEFTISVWVYSRLVSKWARIIDFGNDNPNDNIVLTFDSGNSRTISEFKIDIWSIKKITWKKRCVSSASTQSVKIHKSHLKWHYDEPFKVMVILTNYVTVTFIKIKSLFRSIFYFGKSNWGGNGYSWSDMVELEFEPKWNQPVDE